MKTLRTITAVAVIVGVGALNARGGDGIASLTINDQIRAAIASFQEQKTEFLKKQRDETQSTKDKARDEIRDQVAAGSSYGVRHLVRELRQSIEEAKRQAIEQNRKLVQEATEAARSRRPN